MDKVSRVVTTYTILLVLTFSAVLMDSNVSFRESSVNKTNSTDPETDSTGITRHEIIQELLSEVGKENFADKDNFPVIVYSKDDPKHETIASLLSNPPDRTVPQVMGLSAVLNFKPVEVDLPLYYTDYYYGKFLNAQAGTMELNRMPVFTPGNRMNVVRQGYITLNRKYGYVKPQAYYYASGICWTVSTMGYLMDKANIEFENKYGIPLFVFEKGDRSPHTKTYTTYRKSNNGWGYAVFLVSTGGGLDYSFTVNPEIKDIPELADLQLKIVFTASRKHSNAYLGQSIGAYILSNKDF